ncbi:MAG: GNAT family N-acetyltransferase [Clostridiales bacterium]|nr:GNAT family N-acetyltransferase [Clostridiales bacterium]
MDIKSNSMITHTNSIFENEWWLNAVAGNSWEKIVVKKKNDEICASFPIYKDRRLGFKILTMPPFTQTLGIYIEDNGGKLTKKLEKDKKILKQIIEQLPQKCNYDFYLDTNNAYILPFIWKGFSVSPRFTYRLEDIKDVDKVWDGLKENIRTDIRKARGKVVVRDDMSIETLIEMQKKTFARQNRRFPYNCDDIRKLDTVLMEHNARKLLCAVDKEGNVHSATYYAYDDRRCYYLMSGGDPDYRNSGATSLLVWEGIKFASNNSKVFDFEGSMIESIERFVRGFGASPSVYYNVRKNNCILSFFEYMKPKIKKLLKYK